MANDYFTHSDLTRLTLARAENVNALFQAIQDGLDKLPGADLFKERRTSYVADTGTVDAYVVTFAQPIPTAYAVGMTIDFVPSATNTGACTINVNALGAKQILQADGSTPAAGMIVAARVNTLKYDGTAFRVFSVSSTVTPVDGSVTTAKLAASAVTLAKIASSVWSGMNADLIPDTDSTRDLGSSVKKWAEIHADQILAGNLVGLVIWHAANSPPTGFLECDGSAISRTTYAALFGEIGTVFGVGDGSTTFNIPDLRGEWIRGWDNGKGTDSGRVFGSSQAEMVGQHSHGLPSAIGRFTGAGIVGAPGTSATLPAMSTNFNSGTENRVRNIALLPCIKY